MADVHRCETCGATCGPDGKVFWDDSDECSLLRQQLANPTDAHGHPLERCPAGTVGRLNDHVRELEQQLADVTAERDELRRLRDFDTGVESLPKGMMLEYTRLDLMWRTLVSERDAARQATEAAVKERTSVALLMDRLKADADEAWRISRTVYRNGWANGVQAVADAIAARGEVGK